MKFKGANSVIKCFIFFVVSNKIIQVGEIKWEKKISYPFCFLVNCDMHAASSQILHNKIIWVISASVYFLNYSMHLDSICPESA